MVLNTRVKRALSRKQVSVTPVSNTGIKPHTRDPHQFNTSIDPTKPDKTTQFSQLKLIFPNTVHLLHIKPTETKHSLWSLPHASGIPSLSTFVHPSPSPLSKRS
jgi:hypothetical protein